LSLDNLKVSVTLDSLGMRRGIVNHSPDTPAMLGTIILTILPEVAAPLAAWSTFLYAVLLLVIVLAMPAASRHFWTIATAVRWRATAPSFHVLPRSRHRAREHGGRTLSLRGIALSFGNVRAIDGLDLDVKPGRSTA